MNSSRKWLPSSRTRGCARSSTATWLAGTAEAIPLPDASVDAVFVGDAFHPSGRRRPRRPQQQLGPQGAARAASEAVPGRSRRHLASLPRDAKPGDFPDWTDVVQPEGPVVFERSVRISGRDLVDLHLTASTPASIPDDERAVIATRAYPLMDE